MIFLVPLITLFISDILCNHWTYEDISHWPDKCKNGKSQSPINFEDEETMETNYAKFEFENYHTEFEAVIKNVGHSVSLRISNSTVLPNIKGGGLTKGYTFDHLHFHWKSEHTLDGYRFPLEVHLVHYATEYSNLLNALNYNDGIAVLGILYDLSPDDDVLFQPFIRVMENVVEHPHAVKILDKIELSNFLPRNVAGYYRYNGSLTTPNCNESVIWTVFTNTVPISEKQLQHFRSVHSETGILRTTYRSVQELNGRIVYKKVSPLPRNLATSEQGNNNYYCVLLTVIYLILSNVRK